MLGTTTPRLGEHSHRHDQVDATDECLVMQCPDGTIAALGGDKCPRVVDQRHPSDGLAVGLPRQHTQLHELVAGHIPLLLSECAVVGLELVNRGHSLGDARTPDDGFPAPPARSR